MRWKRFRQSPKRKTGVNPYFQERALARERRVLWVRVSVSLLCLGAIWTAFWSPWVRIRHVDVIGASEELNQEVTARVTQVLHQRVLLALPKNHRLWLTDRALERVAMDQLPISRAHVDRTRTPWQLQLQEAIGRLYLLQNDRLYALDGGGAVLGAVEDLERIRLTMAMKAGEGPPLIRDLRMNRPEGSGLDAETLQSVVKMFQTLQVQGGLSATSADLMDEPGRVNVQTDHGVTLYLTLELPIADQLAKLKTLMDRNLVDVTQLSYIDLRFDNRLYYH